MASPAFRERYGEWAVVAGASEGLGAAFAPAIAARGIHLILLARRADALRATADSIRAEYGVEVQSVTLDLASPNVQAEFEACIAGREVGLLIYNAAYPKLGRYQRLPPDDNLHHTAVNSAGPVILISVLAPPMIARKRGGLIFMTSVVGMHGT